jgi:hypothetical protein
VLLRFQGGFLDGLEEDSPSTPALLHRTRHSGDTVPSTENLERDATYELVHIDYTAGVALYVLVED